jgi:hypothetical protein
LLFGSLNYDIDRHFRLLSNETTINTIKYLLLLTISSNYIYIHTYIHIYLHITHTHTHILLHKIYTSFTPNIFTLFTHSWFLTTHSNAPISAHILAVHTHYFFFWSTQAHISFSFMHTHPLTYLSTSHTNNFILDFACWFCLERTIEIHKYIYIYITDYYFFKVVKQVTV